MQRRLIRGGLAAAVVLAAALVPVAAGDDGDVGAPRAPQRPDPPLEDLRPDRASLSASGRTIAATVGTHCLETPREGYCLDATGAVPARPVLRAGAGGTVTIVLGARATRVDAGVVRRAAPLSPSEPIPRAIAARPVGDTGRRWTVRLPAVHPRGDALQLRVRFRGLSGDAVPFGAAVAPR